MPQRRGRTARVASVARLQQQRLIPTNEVDRTSGPTPGCLAGTCPNPVLADAPVNLCGKHVREVYQYAQGVIDERWLPAVVALLDD